MSMKYTKNSARPDGLVPTLFMFETLPGFVIPTETTSKSTFQRAAALRKANANMSKHFT